MSNNSIQRDELEARSNVFLRSVGAEQGRLGFSDLGMGETTRAHFADALAGARGLVLATGPSGSGRTTTMVAATEYIRAQRPKMRNEEGPPGELFVPEIRDAATAELAIQGVRAGCLVVSTLRAHDAASATTRLLALGMAPDVVSARVRAIIAQRLVRMACRHCREEVPVRNATSDATLPRTEWRGAGCARCGGLGYLGCTGIFELFVFEPDLGRLSINARGPTLYEDGFRQVRAGVTTVEEVARAMAVRP